MSVVNRSRGLEIQAYVDTCCVRIIDVHHNLSSEFNFGQNEITTYVSFTLFNHYREEAETVLVN
jgi:hypothetical protein